MRHWSVLAHELGSRTEKAQTAADVEARRAVVDERSRLARELHDVVAHSVTVLTLQAGGARMLLASEPSRALEAIRSVEKCGHEALAELRHMGEGLPSTKPDRLDPAPGLGRLDELVARVRGAGLELAVETVGPPPALSPGLELTLYRIVQEALTNAMRHGAGRAQLWIGYETEEVKIEVSNPVRRSPSGTGGGLVGLRERASLFGGSVEADLVADGRFVLTAWLPT